MRLILVAVLVAFVLTISACGSTSPTSTFKPDASGVWPDGKCRSSECANDPTANIDTAPAATAACVRYLVTGSARSANVTYQTPTGQSQAAVDLPMTSKDGSKGLRMCGLTAGTFLYISAQNQGATGDVTCEIRVRSDEISLSASKNTGQGAYAIATCQATL